MTATPHPRARSTPAWRPLALVAALGLVASAGAATAQTIMVRQAPAGGTVELVINAAVVATGTATADGQVTLVAPGANRADIDALVFVDSCGVNRRVVFVQPGAVTPPPDAACVRREIRGLFLVRAVSTIVVHVEGVNPHLLLRQGPFDPNAPPRTWTAVPSGLMISGGGGFGGFSNAGTNACGNVTVCTTDDSGLLYSAGAEFWFGRYVAAEVGFVKPAKTAAEGSDSGYSFTDALDAGVVTFGGKVGVPVGPVRIYGKGGMNRHRALSSTSQTIDTRTITVDAVTVAIPGGTQVLEYETAGWGWQFGAGLDLWMSRHVAFYAEGNFIKIKGSDRGEGEALLADTHMSAIAGVRLRLGR